MRCARQYRGLAVIAGLLLGAIGCVHAPRGGFGHAPVGQETIPHIAVPPPDAVPRELAKVTLPPYVIEAPDVLLIEVRQKSMVEGKLTTAGLELQPISGQFQVRVDGTVGLGYWGAVPVSGLTLEEAANTIRNHLLQKDEIKGLKLDALIVIVDVIAYNSKRYYVITDGGGFGEQVFPFPITGSETVLDAISNINGLPDVASKRNIWVARRTPHPGQPWQIFPVDWVGITQHGITYTNYQVFPGDRIYVT